VVLGLLSGLFYAGVILSLRVLRQQDAAWLIVLNHLVTVAALLPIVLYFNIWPSGMQWLYLVGFGALQMGFPYLLFAHGLRRIAGHEAAGLVLLEPLLVPVWVWLAWHTTSTYQAPGWWTFLGGGLILAGLLVRYGTSRTSSQLARSS